MSNPLRPFIDSTPHPTKPLFFGSFSSVGCFGQLEFP